MVSKTLCSYGKLSPVTVSLKNMQMCLHAYSKHDYWAIKGIVHSKIMILLSFAHPHVDSNLYDILQNTNQHILKNLLTESLTSIVWTKNIHISRSKNTFFYVPQKKESQVWTDMRVS